MIAKKFRAVAFIACLPFIQAHAFNPDLDLNGSIVKSEGQCNHEKRVYKCFMLEKDAVNYIVAIDSEGVLAVWMVKDVKDSYTEGEMKLMWQRQGRRKEDV